MKGDRLKARYRLDRPGFTLDVDLDLPARGVTGLYGASGSGKTTLLRCLAGLETAASGRFALGERLFDDTRSGVRLAPHERGIGFVFQEPRLFAHLSVERNIRYGSKRTDRQPVVAFDELVGLLGIERLLARRAAGLSGGEAQRVAIARALMSAPCLLLMDEPLASLDQRRREDILPFLETLHAQLPIPMLYVSHQLDEILRLADALAVVERGSLLASGGLSELLTNAGQAGLGSANAGVVLDGVAGAPDAEYGMTPVTTSAGLLWVAGQYAAETPLRLIVRANDVSVSIGPLEDTSIQNSLAARIARLDEEAGATLRLVLDVDGQDLIARVTRRAAANLDLMPGKGVYAHIKSAAVRRHPLAGQGSADDG